MGQSTSTSLTPGSEGRSLYLRETVTVFHPVMKTWQVVEESDDCYPAHQQHAMS